MVTTTPMVVRIVLVAFVGSVVCQPEFITICNEAGGRSTHGPGFETGEVVQDGAVPKGCWAETANGYVYCIGVQLESIPKTLPLSVTCLVIEQGGINKFDASDINYLGNLQVLGLFSNPLESVSGVFDHPSLEVLALNGGNLTTVPPVVNGKLRRLELQNNKIQMLDLSLVQGNPVRTLDFGNNPFTDFPTSGLELFSKTLTNLFLFSSKIEILDDTSFPPLPNLRSLHISANTLKQDAFKSVANQLTDFSFSTCTIGTNGLRGVQLTSLKLGYSISCKDPSEGLQLQERSFNGMNRLQQLDLDNTKLQYVPKDAFRGLPSLTAALLIEFNRVQTVSSGAFNGLPGLTQLRLTNNYGSTVDMPDTVFSEAGLRNLTLLDLSSFQIRSLTDNMFKNLPNLIYLYLGFNQMSTMTEGVLTPVLPHLQRLTLYGNPWICDCKLKWLRELVDKKKAIFDPSTTYLWKCAGPSDVKGKIFTDLKPADFKC